MRKIIFAIFLGIAVLFWITPKPVSAQGCSCDLEWVERTERNADYSTFTYYTWWCPASCGNLNISCEAGYYGCQDASGNASCCQNGGPSCFLAGTEIKTEQGNKKIEDIKIGDSVTSFEGDKIVESKVSQIYERQRDYYYSLTAGNYKVEASAEHPFYIGNDEFREISKLKAGDTVFVTEKDKLTPKIISSNIKIDKSAAVYNLSVDNTQTFFANSFAVHNLKCSCGLDPHQSCTGNPEVCRDQCMDNSDSPSGNCTCAHSHFNTSGTCPYGQKIRFVKI